MPSGPGVRVDTAIGPGERVPPDYDPMIAKIMAVGRDRQAALRRLRRALDEVEVTGIQTTLPFDRALVRDPRFLAGDELAIDWVERYWDGPAARAASFGAAQVAAAQVATTMEPDAPTSTDRARQAASLRKDDAGEWRAAGRRAGIERWRR